MHYLIYLLVFANVLLLVYIFVSGVLPFLVNLHNRWQEKRSVRLVNKFEESFIFVEKKLALFYAFAPLIFAGAGVLVTKNLLGSVFGFLVGLAMPGVLVKMARKNRLRKFLGQFLDMLMILSSSLKSGLSLIQALEVLYEEMPAPASEELGLVLKENKLGINLEESLRGLAKRMPLEETKLLVNSIIVARETGGELTKVFVRLTETIRNNMKLKEKINTLTLQGRLQGIIMAILPIIFTIFIYHQNPGHFDIMFQTQIGKMLIVAAVAGQIIGMILIKKISTPKI